MKAKRMILHHERHPLIQINCNQTEYDLMAKKTLRSSSIEGRTGVRVRLV